MAKKTQPHMATSDFNMEKLSTQELSEHLQTSVEIGQNIAVFGRRGTGKTEIAKQVIAASDCEEVYLNLSVLERTDLAGYPKIFTRDEADRYVNFLIPKYLKPLYEAKKPCVVLFDELDKADSSLWAPLLEFTQFKSLNGTDLPKLRSVIMTGNLISEGGARPSLPLLDRAESYLVEADASSWLSWAGKSGKIHPSITAYINDHNKELFGLADPEDRYKDPSPRGWTRASQILFSGEQRGWSSNLLNKKVAGCVGKESGIKYSTYYEHYQQLTPMINDLYEGKDIGKRYSSLEPTKKLVSCMIVCSRLANILDNFAETDKYKKDFKVEKLPKTIPYVGKFLQTASYENVLASVRSQITLDRLLKFQLDEAPFFDELLTKINKITTTE